MDTRTMLLHGKYHEAVKENGKSAVKNEIDYMIFHDLANKALDAARALGYTELANLAATVVRNSEAILRMKKKSQLLKKKQLLH